MSRICDVMNMSHICYTCSHAESVKNSMVHVMYKCKHLTANYKTPGEVRDSRTKRVGGNKSVLQT